MTVFVYIYTNFKVTSNRSFQVLYILFFHKFIWSSCVLDVGEYVAAPHLELLPWNCVLK